MPSLPISTAEVSRTHTYGSVVFLGAEWEDPSSGQTLFFHPSLAERFEASGLTAPRVVPRWWMFNSPGGAEETRPDTDEDQYRFMSSPYPNPEDEAAVEAFRERLRTQGLVSNGNWVGLTSAGPFRRVAPGDTLKVTFALVAALKPEEFQGLEGRRVDTEETQALLRTNILWARRTYSGEDSDFNGLLDAGEDVNGNGVLDRYLIPEPPRAPNVRAELEEGRVVLYWDRFAETSVDPVTGEQDFEGYRIYRSDLGDDRGGNLLNSATLVAQFDTPGNRTGYNNGFQDILLAEPRTFEGDTTRYYYRYQSEGLLSGWQYAFAVTALDEGDVAAGLESFESSRVASALRVFPGTPAASGRAVGVYPNPYRVGAAWDGTTSRSRRLNFYNLPLRAEVRIYTLAGEIVDEFLHDEASSGGDIRWYDEFSTDERQTASGEHSWDLLSRNGLNLATGLYLFTVKDLDTGDTQTGKFVIIK